MKLCPYPFSRIQTTHNRRTSKLEGSFVPCCSSWFNKEYEQIAPEENIDDVWNGKAATELRKKMYEGDYSFCNMSECKMPLFTVEELSDPKMVFLETPIAPENIEAIKRRDPVMPKSPSSFHLSADLRCNLACPTCRPKIIPNTSASPSAIEEYDYVHRSKADIEIIKMSSSGEVFYSHTQRELLKSLNAVDFPKLRRVHIVSNGTLFNKKTYADLSPGTTYIKDVSISIDAGSKEVYEKIRGPYWEQISANLIWLGEMRKAGKFDFLSLNFTVITDNFTDIPNLVALGKKIGVDRILLQRYVKIPEQGFNVDQQHDQSIHLDNHPRHQELLNILRTYQEEPVLYSLLDIPGYEHKLNENVTIKKAFAIAVNAQEFLKEGKLDEAFTSIKQAIELLPNENFNQILSEIYFQMGMELLESNDSENALTYFKNVIALDDYKISNFDNFIINQLKDRIFSLGSIDHYENLLKTFNVYSALRPVEDDVYYALGMAHKQAQNFEQAEDCFKAAFNSSQHYYSLLELAFLEQQKMNYQKAISYFTEAKKIVPMDSSINFDEQIYYLLTHIAQNEKSAGHLAPALSSYYKALELAPTDKRVEIEQQIYYCLIDLAFKAKENLDVDSAIAHFQEASKFEPLEKAGEAKKYENDTCYYHLRDQGFLLQKKGKYQSATESFSEALRYNSGDADLFFSYGISLKRTKQTLSAEEMFKKVLVDLPDHFAAILELGCIEYSRGEKGSAGRLFQQTLTLAPSIHHKRIHKLIRLAQRKK